MLGKFKKSFAQQAGFTLLEILLVVAAIGILAGIVILAINPAKQLGDTRNAQRKTDVNTILNAVYQYSLDNNGSLPTGIVVVGASCGVTAGAEICKNGVAAATCTTDGFTNLSDLTALEKYLVSIPIDASGSTTNGTKYRVVKTANNRVTVCAPLAEQGITISATR